MSDIEQDFGSLLANQLAVRDQLHTLKRNYDKTSVIRRTSGYVKGRLDSASSYWKAFCTNDVDLRSYSEYAKTEYATMKMFEIEDDFYSTFIGDLSDRLTELSVGTSTSTASATASPPSAVRIHLPHITLPTFDGNYAAWASFKDMFVSLVHSNNSLSNVEKLQYLKANLRGAASIVLRNTTITNDNYAVAWNALEARFANKKALVDVQLKALINQPSHQCESVANIRDLIDHTQESLNALRALEIGVDSWDPLLLFILMQKLSKETHAAWELGQQGKAELPTIADFITFLEFRFRMLETLTDHSHSFTSQSTPKVNRHIKSHAAVSAASTKPCPFCAEHHFIRQCELFRQLSVADRRNTLKQHRVCFNCLVPGHFVSDCKSLSRCQKCNKNHHTMIHMNSTSSTVSTAAQPQQQSSSSIQQPSSSQIPQQLPSNHVASGPIPLTSHTSSSSSFKPSTVLLATAIIDVMSPTGQLVPLRALIDQGSEVTMMTENAFQLLQLKGNPTNWPISGIGNTPAGTVRCVAELAFRSRHNMEFGLRTKALVLKTITGLIPRTQVSSSNWSHLKNVQLADPTYATPGKIDVLLGADVYKHIILPGIIFGAADAPVAQSTRLGWILSGNVTSTNIATADDAYHSHHTSLHTCINIDDRLKNFWEIEEIPNKIPHHTDEEKQCEQHYVDTHRKSSDGRYVVRLPLRSSFALGESRASALQRFHQLERSLQLKPERKTAYIDVMREYIQLGHMKVATHQQGNYVIPHHAVFKESSSTTKTRVVFDASHKSTNGKSLNENMLIGAKIQDDLSTILLRWRRYPIAFTSDIEKMYRQIWVHPNDQHLQHILWRESPNDAIVEYALQTVTFGTSCAPHLAIRTLRQLAIDNESAFPKASTIIRNDFYVDDLLSGSYSATDAMVLRRQLCEIMRTAGFNLRKWVCNQPSFLDEIPLCDQAIQQPLSIDFNNTVTALGIIWNPATDAFNFKLKLPTTVDDRPATKRSILSEISKLFDPLGWLSPVIIRCKMFMQHLWVKGVSWDDPLPDNTCSLWSALRADLFNVNIIKINRWIFHRNCNDAIEIHGFSDASTNAYAAVIYARIRQSNGSYTTTLLTAKTRVAPLKQISIPRLELCGANLVAELLKHTQQTLNIADNQLFAWTDSSIVLNWLHGEPRKWKTFVANRVSLIQQLLPISCWRHVPTSDNPADCASRGLDAVSLHSFDLWWHGPSWLHQEQISWPKMKSSSTETHQPDSEQQIIVNTTTAAPSNDMTERLATFSSIGRLLRVTSYCHRFISACRKTSSHNSTIVSAGELQHSLTSWIIISQNNSFHHDIKHIKAKRPLASSSKLQSLNPFLDDDGILRVGGRLQNTDLPFHEKHPIILSHNCHLSNLIIRQHHFQTMHGGPQLVFGLIRKKYWILNARNTIRLHIHRCVTCHRFNAASATQLMGSLPEPRVNITRAFTHAGVDYAGPINVRMSKGRGNKSYKGYISLFICLCTKAIHLEAVSDLTAQAFIAAYRRFVSRRGLPAHMYSDNGTNFVGAAKILRKEAEASLIQIDASLINIAANDNTEWHFIPPSSPHFGGLWEAGVKSLKRHLNRTIGGAMLTYEELSTVLAQVEACLNSRPLSPMTTDINDLTALTPGHFLIGDALLAAPDRDQCNENISPLARWQMVQRCHQTIALRWRSEYLSRLQQRPKWVSQKDNLKIGDLVLIKDTNNSPLLWPLARVIETHPGTDNLVRVVSVRTAHGIFKRCISKLCPLPI